MTYDVVIAGAGPVGLFLAGELGLAGVSVLVLEKMEDPHSALKQGWMGMRGLNLPSTEAFYRRGLLEEARACSLAWVDPSGKPGFKVAGAPDSQPRFVGHFAGIMLEAKNVDYTRQPYILPGPAASGGMVNLDALETMLAGHAEKLGVEIRRGMGVTGFKVSGDTVTVQAGKESFQARWLAGCDGGRSTVRRLAEFDFPGTEPQSVGYTASVEFSNPGNLLPGFHLTPNGLYIYGPGPDRIGVVDFDISANREEKVTLEILQSVLRRVSGMDVSLAKVKVASTYTDRARQAVSYRKGRILLAGDAAHIHAPLGGQGMNTGLSDAMNLGWKLAAVIRRQANEELLDTYTEERHPAGAWALDWTRAQIAIMRPDPFSHAISSVVRDLIGTRDGATYIAEKISGMSQHYDLPGNHPLIGCSAPDFEFDDGSRLGPLLREGTGLLADFSSHNSLAPLAGKWQGRAKYVAADPKEDLGIEAMLVRPDGVVAWASEAGSAPDLDALEAALQRWLGDLKQK